MTFILIFHLGDCTGLPDKPQMFTEGVRLRQRCVFSQLLFTRIGLRKCGARFEALLRGPTQWCVEIFEGVHGVIIVIGDVTKTRPVRVTPRPLQQRLQWTAPLNPINQRISTLINTSFLARHLPDQKEGTSVVPAERY